MLLNCTQRTEALQARLADVRPPAGRSADLRVYGIGAQILRDLGVRRVRLLTNNPRKVRGLEAYGVDVVERLPLEVPARSGNIAYLRTKQQKLGHLFSGLKLIS